MNAVTFKELLYKKTVKNTDRFAYSAIFNATIFVIVHHANTANLTFKSLKSISPTLVLNSRSLVRACISEGKVFHTIGAKVRELLYPKVIWLVFEIRSKGFLF